MAFNRLARPLRGIPDFIYLTVAASVMALATAYFVGNWLYLAIMYVPIFLYIEGLSRSPLFLGWVIAWRSRVAFWIGIVLLMLGLVYFVYPQSGLAIGPGFHPDFSRAKHLYVANFVVGTILGILLRHACGRLAVAALLGKKRLTLNILVIAIWNVSIILFPWAAHGIAGGWYILGAAFGMMLHKGSSPACNAAAYRRIHGIADAWPPGAAAKPAELEALDLLARGSFRKLRKKLDRWKGSAEYTTRLALVSAAVYRHEGEYDRSLNETTEALQGDAGAPEAAHLLLLKAVNLAEAVAKDAEADDCLNKLLSSDEGAACPLAVSTEALWAAERVLLDAEHLEVTDTPLSKARLALQARRELMRKRMEDKSANNKSVDDILRRFVELGMPVTAASIVDVLAYCHLAAGYPEEALPMFERCIEMDPDYARAYLHLGDYFLFRERLGSAVYPNRSDLWHSEACYCLACHLEHNQHSRTSRLARERRSFVQQQRRLRDAGAQTSRTSEAEVPSRIHRNSKSTA